MKFLKIGLPIIAVVAIAIALGIFIFMRTHPLLVTGRALANFNDELSERIDATPLRVAGLLADILEDGAVNVELSYTYRVGFWTRGNSSSVTLSSNIADREFSLGADISLGGLTFDAEAFLNRERLAVGSGVLGDNYYGITFSTFGDDILRFGRVVGLDNQTIDTLISAVEMLERILNMDEFDDAVLEPYMRLVEDFIRSLRPTSERIRSNTPKWQGIRITRIEYVITSNDISQFLYDLVTLISDDENISGQLESLSSNPMFFDILGSLDMPHDNDIIQALRDVAEVFESDFYGEIAFAFYIDRQDRLKLVHVRVDAEFHGEKVFIRTGIDFGLTAMCDWMFGVTVISDDVPRFNRMVWEIREGLDEIENFLRFYFDGLSEDLSLIWSTESGRIYLKFPDSWGHEDISGVLLVYEDAFSLYIDSFPLTLDIPFTRFLSPEMEVVISAESGAQIREIEFVNIDGWGQEIVQRLGSLLFGLILF